jgi:hypothetical protein
MKVTHTRRLIISGAALLLLLALAPLASARRADSPPLQATPTAQATATVEPTLTATSDGAPVSTPATLPETGGEANTTPWIPILIIAIAVTMLLLGMGLAAGSRMRSG